MTERNDAGDGVGEELSRARAALGFTIADVAQQLKFAARQIEALEHGRYEQLPAGTFARGMVRTYARLVRLDPEPLVQRIADRVAVPDNAAAVASARRPIPITDSARRTNLIYAALSLAILAVIAGVVFEWQRERSDAARLTFVPAAAPAPAPAAKEPPQVASTAVSVAAMAIGPGGVAAPEPDAAPAAPDAGAGPAAAEGMRRLHLAYEGESWVEIRAHGDKLLTSRLNAGGTEQTIEGRPPFSLIIGNAQHVRLSYDDKPVDLAPYIKVEVARFTLD
ncbi:MAG TPA: RodZ domain-containing protein [Burkholderiales bacterium]|nr:RodZ domain-containing protein [Burkholderiales bacterium]